MVEENKVIRLDASTPSVFENALQVDWGNMSVKNFEEYLALAEQIKERYKGLIINSEEELKGIDSAKGGNSAKKNLRLLSKTIDDMRKAYNKQLKEKGKRPVKQFLAIKAEIDEALESVNESILSFNNEQEKKREERLKNTFLSVYADFDKNEGFCSDFMVLYQYETFFKTQYIKKSNHVAKMKDNGLEKFIVDYFVQIQNTIDLLTDTVQGFEQNGIALDKKIINDKFIELIKDNLQTEEKPNPQVINGILFTWLNEQKKQYEQNIIAKQREEQKRKELEEKQQPNNVADSPFDNTPNVQQQNQAPTIQVTEPSSVPEEQSDAYWFLLSLTESQLNDLKNYLFEKGIDYRVKKA